MDLQQRGLIRKKQGDERWLDRRVRQEDLSLVFLEIDLKK